MPIKVVSTSTGSEVQLKNLKFNDPSEKTVHIAYAKVNEEYTLVYVNGVEFKITFTANKSASTSDTVSTTKKSLYIDSNSAGTLSVKIEKTNSNDKLYKDITFTGIVYCTVNAECYNSSGIRMNYLEAIGSNNSFSIILPANQNSVTKSGISIPTSGTKYSTWTTGTAIRKLYCYVTVNVYVYWYGHSFLTTLVNSSYSEQGALATKNSCSCTLNDSSTVTGTVKY